MHPIYAYELKYLRGNSLQEYRQEKCRRDHEKKYGRLIRFIRIISIQGAVGLAALPAVYV